MKILCFGSLNIDHVYKVEHFVRPGETIKCHEYFKTYGGKGLNQSVALVKSGANVSHAGKIGSEGIFLKEYLEELNINTKYLELTDTPTGHAIIQVNKKGENSITLYSGANSTITTTDIENTLRDFSKNDHLLLQNEINNISTIINIAYEIGMKIFFNPAPITGDIVNYPLEKVNCFIINEIEGRELTNKKKPEDILLIMGKKFPEALTVLTLGENGVMALSKDKTLKIPCFKVYAKDTTAAGDTFTGYLLSELSKNKPLKESLVFASKAASITVSRQGAAQSIPFRDEIKI